MSGTCLSCVDSDNRVLNTNTMQCDCKSNYYAEISLSSSTSSSSSSNNKCVPCPTYCNSCTNINNSLQCTSCPNYSTLNRQNNQSCSCKQGYYSSGQDLCTKCPDGCFQCNDQGVCTNYCGDNCIQCGLLLLAKKCIICKWNYLYQGSGCVQKCDIGYYKDGLECKPCTDPNCNSCESVNTCKECLTSFQLSGNTCRIVCSEKTYKMKGVEQCGKCFDQTNCLECSGKEQYQCTKCSTQSYLQDGECLPSCTQKYYLQPNSNVCKLCSQQISNCQTCQYNNSTLSCSQCFQQFQLSSNTCIAACTEQYNLDPITQQCKPCKVTNCKFCPYSFDTCSSCVFQYYLIGNNDCQNQCPPNYTLNANSQCIVNTVNITKIKVDYISNDDNTILIQFDIPVTYLKAIIDSMQITIPSINKNLYTLDKYILNNQLIKINIYPVNFIQSKEEVFISLIISSKNSTQVLNITKDSLFVKIVKEMQLDTSSQGAVKQLNNISTATSTATLVVMVPLALSGSFWVISSLLDICQLIYLTVFINTKIPLNLDQFLKSQKSFQIPFFNYFQKLENYDSIYYPTFKKIEDNGFQGFLLSNLGDSISLTVTILGGMLFLQLISYTFKNMEKISKYINYAKDKIMCTSFALDLLWSIYLDISFSTIIQVFSTQKPYQVEEYINYIFFALALIFSIVPFLLLYPLQQKTNAILCKAMGENLRCPSYRIVLYFRKLFYTIMAGAIQLSSDAQIYLLISFHLVFFIYIALIKPYHSKFDNYKEGIQSMFFLIASAMYASMHSTEYNEDNNDLIRFGWWIIGIFVAVICCDIISILKDLYQTVRHFIRKRKYEQKMVRVHPSTNILSQYRSSIISKQEMIKSYDMNNDQSGLETIESPKRRRSRSPQNKLKFKRELQQSLSQLRDRISPNQSILNLDNQPSISELRYLNQPRICSPLNNIESGLEMNQILRIKKVQTGQHNQIKQDKAEDSQIKQDQIQQNKQQTILKSQLIKDVSFSFSQTKVDQESPLKQKSQEFVTQEIFDYDQNKQNCENNQLQQQNHLSQKSTNLEFKSI